MLERENVKYLLSQLKVNYSTKSSTQTLSAKLNRVLATLQESGQSIKISRK